MTAMTRRVPTLVATLVLTISVHACGREDDASPVTTLAATTSSTTHVSSTTVAPDTTSSTDSPTTAPRTTTSTPTTAAATSTTQPEPVATAPAAPVPETTTTTTTTPPVATTVAPATTSPQAVATEVPLPRPVAPPPPRANETYVELGTLEIPKIGVTKPLLEGISLNTLDKGPGHWPGTAMPGQQGNVVVAGHRTSKDRPFRNIDQLVVGDEVVFTTADGRFVYTVTGTQIVLPDAMWIIEQTPAATATLFACHPVGSTRERIVVVLQLQA